MNTKQTITLLAAATLAAYAGAASPPSATYIPADKVKAAFEKGVPLLEVANYKIHASRRDAAGQVEVHAGDVIVVPNGTPHWFKAVPAPMTYYVVKVRAEGAK